MNKKQYLFLIDLLSILNKHNPVIIKLVNKENISNSDNDFIISCIMSRDLYGEGWVDSDPQSYFELCELFNSGYVVEYSNIYIK